MALQLTKKSKGIDANYWKIINSNFDAFGNQTRATMVLYLNKNTRNDDINDYLETKNFYFEGFLNQAEMYTEIKKSSLGKRVLTPAIVEGEFPNTVVVAEAVMEDYETNEFNSALDI